MLSKKEEWQDIPTQPVLHRGSELAGWSALQILWIRTSSSQIQHNVHQPGWLLFSVGHMILRSVILPKQKTNFEMKFVYTSKEIKESNYRFGHIKTVRLSRDLRR